MSRVLKRSRWPANFAGYSTMIRQLLFHKLTLYFKNIHNQQNLRRKFQDHHQNVIILNIVFKSKLFGELRAELYLITCAAGPDIVGLTGFLSFKTKQKLTTAAKQDHQLKNFNRVLKQVENIQVFKSR